MWEQLAGMFANNSWGGGGGGSGVGANAGIFGKIAEIAPEWSPFPILEQLNKGPVQLETAGQVPGMPQAPEWSWMNPTGAPVPPSAAAPLGADPNRMQAGPLAGVSTVPPPIGAVPLPGAAPLSPQQVAALAKMSQSPQQDQQNQMRPPGAPGLPGRPGPVSLQSVMIPGAPKPIPGLAEILGRRR